MAKPDLDDGWLKYAHELDAALAVADFTKGARIVLREVFAQIFGPAKSRTATLSPSGIAEAYGMIRQNVSRAIKELVDAGVLVKVEDGAFRFIKDYESWLRNGSQRLTPKEIECCQSASPKAMAWKLCGVSESIPDRCETVSGSIPKGINLDTKTVSGSIPKGINLDTNSEPPYRNGRGIELENGDKERIETNTPLTPKGEVWVSINGSEPVPIEDAPKPDLPQVDPAELARVQSKAEHLFPMLDFGSKVRGTAASFPLAWIDWSLDDMFAKGKSYWPFLLGILRRIDSEGGLRPRASPKPTQAEKTKADDDVFARVLEDPEFLKVCEQIEGAR